MSRFILSGSEWFGVFSALDADAICATLERTLCAADARGLVMLVLLRGKGLPYVSAGKMPILPNGCPAKPA